MHTYLKHCKIVNREEANSFGFVIEDDMAFIFDLGKGLVGCLGHTSDGPDSHWQFDTVDPELNAFQFVEKDINKALDRAMRVAEGMNIDTLMPIGKKMRMLGLELV